MAAPSHLPASLTLIWHQVRRTGDPHRVAAYGRMDHRRHHPAAAPASRLDSRRASSDAAAARGRGWPSQGQWEWHCRPSDEGGERTAQRRRRQEDEESRMSIGPSPGPWLGIANWGRNFEKRRGRLRGTSTSPQAGAARAPRPGAHSPAGNNGRPGFRTSPCHPGAETRRVRCKRLLATHCRVSRRGRAA